ncbi:hypothetical protein AAVH_32823 [Aphelenchoides avenae]|nr:hypothetical protein AAVH_32823 [Aphelenchus avenae]
MSHASDDDFPEDSRVVHQNLDYSDVNSTRDKAVSTPQAEDHRHQASATSEPSHNDGDERGAGEGAERAQNRSRGPTTQADQPLQERRTCPLCHRLHSATDCTVYDTARKRTRRKDTRLYPAHEGRRDHAALAVTDSTQ